ncbi:phosphonate metabolism protein PhnM [Bacillus salitolerans]|uniref:Phosphonate metabolism protein PhnM n=1 Tax=Bacillus salitolerans TaxID=1437434 RepID=A0ABW4LJ15_9BACI
MSNRKRIVNAKIVTPSKVILDGCLEIEDGVIVSIEEEPLASECSDDIDANGSWVIPGLVDSHSDAIEIEMEPRPSSIFPLEVSFYELEKKLVGEGITTIYHSLSLLEEYAKKWMRQNQTVIGLIKEIVELSKKQHLIRHKTHLRYEITNIDAVKDVQDLIKTKMIDQLSFMDHTPGQGQFRDIEIHKKLLMEHRHYTEEQAENIIQESLGQEKLASTVIEQLAQLAAEYGIPIASHDDDTVEKLSVVKSWNATISEFPIELEVAKRAKEMGLYVVMGAPNALLGKSHSKNLSAIEAIQNGVVDILCSDYYPSSLLHAAFKLYHQHNIPIYKAINMVSINPARALGIDSEVGSIEIGKKADLLIVSEDRTRPVLETVFVNGMIVCQMRYQLPSLALNLS